MELNVGDRVRSREQVALGGDRSGRVVATVWSGKVVGTIGGAGMAAVAVRRDEGDEVSIHFIVNGAEPDLVKDEPEGNVR